MREPDGDTFAGCPEPVPRIGLPTGPEPLRAASEPLVEDAPSTSPRPFAEGVLPRPLEGSVPRPFPSPLFEPDPSAASRSLVELAIRAAFRSLAERVLDGVSVLGALFPACRPACMAFMRYHLRHRL
ncbi:hypothetical protein [Streptomyces tubercidicus]|uniref:Uncharacterized protein n=1 Tax=Streptomyces tubercidicus TaxID=47759 RepID=A0A640UMT0_9ACTN|nr:hypothetical protein [Streptomyces tubercidicus]GFE36999.1 hypothetical protein Stube_16720 [Streptomyces tubercidicus]